MSAGYAFIACSRRKLAHAAPAAELYIGDLFCRSLAYARARGLTPFVLSARHGLIAIDQVIEPYDEALVGMTRPERDLWTARVLDQVERCVAPSALVVLLAGALYREPFDLRPWGLRHYETPMRGLGIGQQRAWLARETARLAAERGGS